MRCEEKASEEVHQLPIDDVKVTPQLSERIKEGEGVTLDVFRDVDCSHDRENMEGVKVIGAVDGDEERGLQ